MSEYTKEETARLGDEVYERRVRPNVDEQADRGKFVAIDTQSGDWEMDADEMQAARRLRERRPQARGRMWFTRVGLGYGAKIGGRPRKEAGA